MNIRATAIGLAMIIPSLAACCMGQQYLSQFGEMKILFVFTRDVERHAFQII